MECPYLEIFSVPKLTGGQTSANWKDNGILFLSPGLGKKLKIDNIHCWKAPGEMSTAIFLAGVQIAMIFWDIYYPFKPLWLMIQQLHS